MDAFHRGVWRQDLREAYGRIQPSSIIEMKKVANQWADGEDFVREDRQHRIKEEGFPAIRDTTGTTKRHGMIEGTQSN